jgi:6-pyruvoyl-tetrahydropterin synthase
MYAVEVRDHIMIGHSLPSPVFGPAQGMHGATFTVDVAFFTEDIDAHGLVVDIGLATEALAETLAPLRYKNLDEVPEFEHKFTTTEFLCGHIFTAMAQHYPAREPRGPCLVRRRSLTRGFFCRVVGVARIC